MIPAEGAQGASLSLVALFAALLATIILALALRGIARRPGIPAALWCGAGLCLAIGATVYVHDMVAMPEAAMTSMAGLGIGYLLTRQGVIPAPPRLAPALLLLAGLVASASAFAAWRNPLAFGTDVGPGPIVLPIVALAGMTITLAATWHLITPLPPAAQARLGAGTGIVAALLGLALGNPPLLLCGGLIAGAGAMLARR